MKKIFLAAACLLIIVVGFSQTPQVPSGQPGRPQLPTPKIAPLTKPDLQVTELRLISIVVNPTTKQSTITVSVTIKNTGQLTAAATNLKAFEQDILTGVALWKGLGAPLAVHAINGGQTLTAEYVFLESPRVIGTSRFNFKVLADEEHSVAESNETNNTSSIITINTH